MSKVSMVLLGLMVLPGYAQNGKPSPGLLYQAEKGDAHSWYTVGNTYKTARGTGHDIKRAVYWFRKAAELGDADAQNDLGGLYQVGEGVVQNQVEAFYWYRRAAAQGHTIGAYNLAFMYEVGDGTDLDLNQAVYWYTQAAEAGDLEAMFNLSALFLRGGPGVPKDPKKAFMWAHLAKEDALELVVRMRARKARELAGQELNNENRHLAREEAKHWLKARKEINRLLSLAAGNVLRGSMRRAYRQLKQAQASAEKEGLPAGQQVAICFDLAQVAGFLGKHQEATELFAKSIVAQQKLTGDNGVMTYRRAFEAARFHFETEEYIQAVKYYDLAVNGADMWGLQINNPLALALRLDNYAIALERIGAKKRATEVRDWTNFIRETNEDKQTPKLRERPYKKTDDG